MSENSVAPRLYVIFEVNCYTKEPSGSVWVANESVMGHLSSYGDHATKLVGPLPAEVATRFLGNLRSILEATGVDIVEETVSDD
jgi:hypothetical protein